MGDHPLPSQRATRLLAALDGASQPPPPPPEAANPFRNPFAPQNAFDLLNGNGQPRAQRGYIAGIREGRDESAHNRMILDATALLGSGASLTNRPTATIAGPSSQAQAIRTGGVHAVQSNLAASGFNLNYDKDTPVNWYDRGGADQAEKLADFVYNSIDKLSHERSVKDAMERLGLHDKRDLLPGLEVRLLPHQAIGVSWMVDQELNTRHKGGILGDDMGLGKTVQMIATMAYNLPKESSSAKVTLIVVPAALLHQWKEELETKTNDLFSVHIHHGKDKLKREDQIDSYDVIITTYQTLCMDFYLPADIEKEDTMQYLSEHGGLLARTKWYRVILDEAQYVRNRRTASSRSVALLRATYRWLLTGTPVTNTLADIYGLLRFGRFRPWNDWEDFNRYIAKVQEEDPPLAAMRAQEILKPLLMRRTKTSEIEGEPILQLPEKHIELVYLDFSEDERELYDKFESRSRVRISRFIKSRTLLKNASAVLVMILRLRQLCCHPNLILSQTEQYADPTLLMSDDKDKERSRAIKEMGIAWVENQKKQFMRRALAQEMLIFDNEAETEPTTCPVCKDMYVNNSMRVLSCGHDLCNDCMMELRQAPIAHDNVFGYGTEQENARAEREYETAAAKGWRPCPTCRAMVDFGVKKTFLGSAFEPDDDVLAGEARRIRRERAAARERRRNPVSTIDISDAEAEEEEEGTEEEEEEEEKSSEEETKPKSGLKATKGKGKGKRTSSVEFSSDDEAKRAAKKTKKSRANSLSGSSSSEDDMPDFSVLRATQSQKKKGATESGGRAKKETGMIDLTMSDSLSEEEEEEESDPGSMAKAKAKATGKGTSKAKGKAAPKTKGKAKGNGKGKAVVNGKKDKEQDKDRGKDRGDSSAGPSAQLIETWRRGDATLEPSTKMLKLVELIEAWDALGDKGICYSQWTSMLDLVESLFTRYGIRSVRYDGSMDRAARERALASFKRADGPRVALISTRCGGVGLNLVAANRVVNLDLSWNYAAEAQAYDRVHRLGQDKEVFVKRLVVRNTIEDRMLHLQAVKSDLADAALGEGSGVRLHKMSVREIKLLFGMTKDNSQSQSQGAGGSQS